MLIDIESNRVTPVTIPDLDLIITLIDSIPLVSNRINDGDLDTRFFFRGGYPFDAGRRRLDFITSRIIVRVLTDFLNISTVPEELNRFSRDKLIHFLNTMMQNYSNDADVKKLLESSNIENFIDIQN